MNLGGTATEAADYGFGGLIVECDPANHGETYSSP
jgi:hypothetical protein